MYKYELDDDGHVYLEPGTDPLEDDELSPHVAKLNTSREDWREHAKVFDANLHGLIRMLTRLTEKVERANTIQHSGVKVLPEDWSELYQLTNEARAIIGPSA
jgi:hypothetical protein